MTADELISQAWEYRELWSRLTKVADELAEGNTGDGLVQLHEVRDAVYQRMMDLEEETQDAGNH
jgi:hypothetical protein